MRDETKSRSNYSTGRLEELREALSEAQSIARDVACVYSTGSYGRVEANENSDLDVFIVGLSKDEVGKRDGVIREVSVRISPHRDRPFHRIVISRFTHRDHPFHAS